MRQKKSKRLLPKVVLIAALVVGIYIFGPFGSTGGSDVLSSLNFTAHSAPNAPAEARAAVEFSEFSLQIPVTEIEDTQYLKLVNRDFPIHTPISPARLMALWPDISVRATDVTLHESARSAMLALYQAARQAGIRNLFVASGFRNQEEQRELYQNAVDRALVMPPGHSEHQLGLGVDILASGLYDTGGMSGSSEARWLAEHAPQFGLILRYPYEKQHITDVAYEPWHFRYVGRIHAWMMGQYGFVLEEYIDFLQRNGSYQTEFDGREWYILYQRPENGMIFVPHDMNFNVSGANTGGYIVTAWR